ADGPGAARHRPGKPRNAHAGGREKGGLTAGQAHRADDHLLPAVPVRRDSGAGDHEDHAYRSLAAPSGLRIASAATATSPTSAAHARAGEEGRAKTRQTLGPALLRGP